ncbi:aspartyl-phosphate phosphatase Spo0E family protein [Priestia megaterium]|uniref:aspartyl-phosphate phosphatase Spo0E family protein n=1 Tax=Priestia megaterium TaxID=1404 RepID=UPI003009D688
MSMVVNPVGQVEDLRKCISKKRKELIDLGSNYGLLDEKTIKCSQDLDKLINLHMKSYSGSTNMFLDNGGGYLEQDTRMVIIKLVISNMR